MPASLSKEMVWEFSSAWWKINQSEFLLNDSLFTKNMLIHVLCMRWNIYIYIYIFNTVNNKERGHGQWSVLWLKCSYPCLHHLHVLTTAFSWWPLSSFSLWIILVLHPSPSLIFFYWIDISVWQVPGSIGVGAHGWRAWVFRPWGHTSLGAGCTKSGSPWAPRAPTSTKQCSC